MGGNKNQISTHQTLNRPELTLIRVQQTLKEFLCLRSVRFKYQENRVLQRGATYRTMADFENSRPKTQA